MPQSATVQETSPAQLQAIAVLITGKSITEAAQVAGCDRSTVHRWLRDDPAFVAEYATARAEIVEHVRREVAELGKHAVAMLREALTQSTSRPIRLRAALAVLKMLGADQPEALKPITVREAELEIKRREDDLEDEDDRLNLLGMFRGRMALESAREESNGAAVEDE